MHDVLRQRLLRKIETLPEEQIYQVLDYIEFLESKYGAADLSEETSGLQRFAERLEDGLRRRTVSPSTLREAFQLISAADRVLSGVSSAGRQLLEELNGSDLSDRSGGRVRGPGGREERASPAEEDAAERG